MRRLLTRTLVALIVLAGVTTTTGWALAAAAQRAQQVALHTVAVGSVAAGEQGVARALPIRADMIGARWRGASDAIELRVRSPRGAWSRWVEVHASDDGPDPRASEARRAARSVGAARTATSPIWVGAADRVQVRSHDRHALRDVELVAINATGTATATDRAVTSAHERASYVLGATAHAVAGGPKIRRRAEWKAAEPRTGAVTAPAGLKGAVIHHTAGTNRYTCAQVPALLRGIQRYHQITQGWNDIGYNYLVDRCGRVWEGRGGGVKQDVVGAHAAGFNTGTTGIALIGTHDSPSMTRPMRHSLVKLLSWRMDVAHVKPTGKMALIAGSSDKFPAGSRVVARAVSGHRDLFPTSCPGALTYRQLNAIAREAWASGGAKVANITSSFRLRNPSDPLDASIRSMSARAVASRPKSWMVIRFERLSTGELLHREARRGSSIVARWTVPAHLSVPSWDVRIVADARRGKNKARRAIVPLERALPDSPQLAVPTPPTVVAGTVPASPTVQLAVQIQQQYRVAVTVHDPATGAQLASLRAAAYLPALGVPQPLTLPLPAAPPFPATPALTPGATYELRVSAPADPARGRSVLRFPITIP